MARVTDPEVKYDLPTFTQHLRNLEVKEKGTAVLECRVEPAKDPTMKIGKTRNSKNYSPYYVTLLRWSESHSVPSDKIKCTQA